MDGVLPGAGGVRSKTVTAIDLPDADEAAESAESAIDEVRELLVEGREQGYLTSSTSATCCRTSSLRPSRSRQPLSSLRRPGIEILEGDETASGRCRQRR